MHAMQSEVRFGGCIVNLYISTYQAYLTSQPYILLNLGCLLIRLDSKTLDYQLIQLTQLDILKFYMASVTYLSLT